MLRITLISWLFSSLALASSVNAFVIPQSATATTTATALCSRSSTSSTAKFSTTQDASSPSSPSSSSLETNDKGLLKRDRYIATNRFAVRQNRAAKFEKRWATRKSRLAELDGFKYFHLMRRVKFDEKTNDDGTAKLIYDEGTDEKSAQGNYVSFTIWNKKSDFSAWRTGEAFKEAHGGTSIGAFVSTMVNSAFVLRGPPRPAFYDGLLVQSMVPDDIPQTVDGWRDTASLSKNVNLGEEILPAECFVAQNQFFVPPENAAAFEKKWAERESKLKECEGFVAFTMMRRDGQTKGHGTVPMESDEPTYLSTTIWKNVESFNNWRKGSAFQKAHAGAAGAANKKEKGEGNDDGKTEKPVEKPLWTRPPKPVFYEGTLVITNKDGA